MSQLQYRNENQNFIPNFVFQFIKKTKWHFRYTDSQTNTLTPFRTPVTAISDFIKYGLNPEKYEKKSKVSPIEMTSFKKKVVSSAYAKVVIIKDCHSLNLRFRFYKKK